MVSRAEVLARYPAVYETFEQLPEDIVIATYERTIGREWDIATPLKNGKAWAFEGMRENQRRTYGVLMGAGELEIVRRAHDAGNVQALILTVGNSVVEVCRNFWGQNPADPGYQNWIDRIEAKLTRERGRAARKNERQRSLPDEIRRAYYDRLDGLNLPRRVPWGVEYRLLPRPTRGWDTIDGYLKGLGIDKQALPIVEEMIPGIRPEQKDMPFVNFMLFLDCRPDVAGLEGDVFFVKNHIQDGIVYYSRDGDVANMMILSNPADAIDRYCEWVLLGKEGRFDFRAYAMPLRSS